MKFQESSTSKDGMMGLTSTSYCWGSVVLACSFPKRLVSPCLPAMRSNAGLGDLDRRMAVGKRSTWWASMRPCALAIKVTWLAGKNSDIVWKDWMNRTHFYINSGKWDTIKPGIWVKCQCSVLVFATCIPWLGLCLMFILLKFLIILPGMGIATMCVY